mmetsp:Transcript_3292/g.7395  ORF Transcript_3292/g.7395 Transcript_3292/m.7395 type:complete len:205 (-) Transcript_3292:619-1233(-)
MLAIRATNWAASSCAKSSAGCTGQNRPKCSRDVNRCSLGCPTSIRGTSGSAASSTTKRVGVPSWNFASSSWSLPPCNSCQASSTAATVRPRWSRAYWCLRRPALGLGARALTATAGMDPAAVTPQRRRDTARLKSLVSPSLSHRRPCFSHAVTTSATIFFRKSSTGAGRVGKGAGIKPGTMPGPNGGTPHIENGKSVGNAGISA